VSRSVDPVSRSQGPPEIHAEYFFLPSVETFPPPTRASFEFYEDGNSFPPAKPMWYPLSLSRTTFPLFSVTITAPFSLSKMVEEGSLPQIYDSPSVGGDADSMQPSAPPFPHPPSPSPRRSHARPPPHQNIHFRQATSPSPRLSSIPCIMPERLPSQNPSPNRWHGAGSWLKVHYAEIKLSFGIPHSDSLDADSPTQKKAQELLFFLGIPRDSPATLLSERAFRSLKTRLVFTRGRFFLLSIFSRLLFFFPSCGLAAFP